MLKIRSNFIKKKLFKYINEKKILQLAKFNKKLQKLLNISLKDYKIFNQIEIELIPSIYSKKGDIFININNKSKPYIHLYANDNYNTEFKSYKLKDENNISKIKIIIDNEIKSFKGLFKNCECLKKINIIKCNRKDIIDMSEMFYGCQNLIILNLLNLKTNKVKDMSYLFCECSSLINIDLTNFNTSNVNNMQNMFEHCSHLAQLNLNNFNTSNVIYMNNMFSECSALNSLNIDNFDTSNVINMSYMFYNCSYLGELNLTTYKYSSIIFLFLFQIM